MRMPAARATATQWIRWLVEPPVASSATIALTIDALVDQPADRQEARAPLAGAASRVREDGARPRGQRLAQARRAGARRPRPARAGPSPRAASGCCWRCRRRCRCRRRGTPPPRLPAARRGRPGPARTARAPRSFRRWTGRCSSARRARRRTAGGRNAARRSAGPGTILSQTPSSSAASNTSCESAMAVPMAMVSRENRLSSMPGRPCVTPSHIAGTPPATCAVAPSACAFVADQRREALVGLVRRQHVVVGGDDADVRRALGDDAQLVGAAAARRRRARRWRSPCDRRRAGARACASTRAR